jgi:hypothetical protein
MLQPSPVYKQPLIIGNLGISKDHPFYSYYNFLPLLTVFYKKVPENPSYEWHTTPKDHSNNKKKKHIRNITPVHTHHIIQPNVLKKITSVHTVGCMDTKQ